MDGLFTYIRQQMATFKGKWLGKYSHPMEHVGKEFAYKPIRISVGSCHNPSYHAWDWYNWYIYPHLVGFDGK